MAPAGAPDYPTLPWGDWPALGGLASPADVLRATATPSTDTEPPPPAPAPRTHRPEAEAGPSTRMDTDLRRRRNRPAAARPEPDRTFVSWLHLPDRASTSLSS